MDQARNTHLNSALSACHASSLGAALDFFLVGTSVCNWNSIASVRPRRHM
jgi:hypothetical protein